MKKHILNLTTEELTQEIVSLNEKPFRVKQLFDWIYRKKINNFSEIKNLPQKFISILQEKFFLYSLKFVSLEKSSIDNTTRINFHTLDENTVPCVFLPKDNRTTACISTQVGCPIGCYFCNSGKMKFARNLSKGEITEQVLFLEKHFKINIDGILFMGMGEPLLNYDNVVGAIKDFTDEQKFSLGRRKITLSTIGLVPKIYSLAEEILGIKLAISLHAPDDITRLKVVPPKIKYSIEEILKAAVHYIVKNNTKLTIEYVLVSDINDSSLCANRLISLLEKVNIYKKRLKINLIPYNVIAGEKFATPEESKVINFKKLLMEKNFLTIVRESRGKDINAACGQLGW